MTLQFFFVAILMVTSLWGQAAERLQFNRDIRPILSDKCFACHGFDEKTREAKLRLDVQEEAFKKKKRGKPAIVPGDPDASEAWLRIISTDDDEVMPPPDSHKKLDDEEKEILRRWIEQGAGYQKHWAFETPKDPEIPPGSGTAIDRFLQDQLSKKGWSFSPEADRETLIRRVSFALTGLPPSLEEIDQFLNDKSEKAYEQMVDRHLASPRYGEEMARHWLDAARYGDTHGMHLDNERQMWAYRDWVITAFNQNLSYDQFTIDQLAGDLLPTPSQDQLVATGFNRCNVTTGEGGSIAKEFIFRYAVDRASTTAQVWLGLTAQCAVCHDHKYDPITQKDFYSLYAFFHSNADPAMDGNALLTAPSIKVKPDTYEDKIRHFTTSISEQVTAMKQTAAWKNYRDPAEATPPLPPVETKTIWFDDAFPEGAKVIASGHPTTLVVEPVFKGEKSLRRSGKEMAQDSYNSGAAPLHVPSNAKIFVNVYLDPNDPPKEIMLQYHTDSWRHRALWGEDLVDFGKKGTTERHRVGELPKTGEWVKLEVPAKDLGLTDGMQVTGYAFTVYGGTAYFDQSGVIGRQDPANDPNASFLAWKKSEMNKAEKEKYSGNEGQLREFYLAEVCTSLGEEIASSRNQISQLKKEQADFEKSIPSTFVFRDLKTPRKSHIMTRGEYDQPGEEVQPNTPLVLPKLAKAGDRANRLDLARWLVSSENPLTARVAVNRFWQQIFGIGLVETSHDFGTQGSLPSHPELLDHLALSFQKNGWDVKGLVKQLVMTQAFRQQSSAATPRWDSDPKNRLLARGPRFRLDAEQLRDQALYVSGLLDEKMGGRGVMPYQPPNIWEPVAFGGSNTRFYKQGSGSDLYRRSIYTFFKRTAPHPMMTNFDAPAREQFCLKRERSNTPLQALQLMNDVQHFEAARGLAQRTITGHNDPKSRIEFLFRSVLSRIPNDREQELIMTFFESRLERYRSDPESAKMALEFGESKPSPDLDPAELAAWTLVANLVLNMDEAIVRN